MKKNRFRTKKMTFLPLWPPLWLSHSTLRKNWNGQKSRFCVVFDQIMTQTHSIIGFVPKIYVLEWKWYILTFCRLLGGHIFAKISSFSPKNLLKDSFWHFSSKWHYEISWYFEFSQKIIIFNGNFKFWIFKMLGWPKFGQNLAVLAKNHLDWQFFMFFCPRDTTKPYDILVLANKIMLFNGNSIFWIWKFLRCPYFCQCFAIFWHFLKWLFCLET